MDADTSKLTWKYLNIITNILKNDDMITKKRTVAVQVLWPIKEARF